MACFRVAARVGRTRRPVTDVPDEWSSAVAGSPATGYRTRLIGHLAFSLFQDAFEPLGDAFRAVPGL